MWRKFKGKVLNLWLSLEAWECWLYTSMIFILVGFFLLAYRLTNGVKDPSECPTFSISYKCSCVEGGRVYHNGRSAVYVPTKCSVEEK